MERRRRGSVRLLDRDRRPNSCRPGLGFGLSDRWSPGKVLSVVAVSGGDEEESPGVALQACLCWSMGSASLTSCCWAHLSSNPVVVAAVGCNEAVAAAAAAAAWRYAFAELLARVAAS